MLVFLPHGSAQSRVNELRASARTRYEMEAVAIQKYERDVLAIGYTCRCPTTTWTHRQCSRSLEPRRSLA